LFARSQVYKFAGGAQGFNCDGLDKSLGVNSVLALLIGSREAFYYSDASSAQNGIAKAWIPGCLPTSASEIEETHNLDLNTGHGSFTFSDSDAEQLRKTLKEYTADQKLRGGTSRPGYEKLGFEFYTYADFDLAVNWKPCKVEFWLTKSQ
jgi:hypothetical protein